MIGSGCMPPETVEVVEDTPKEKEERRSYQTHDDVWGDQRSRRASMPDITDVSERRDSLFRQTDSGKSVYNSLEEFST